MPCAINSASHSCVQLASNNNPSISKLYILYQMIVIGFSLLGPAIIFTMLVYAQVRLRSHLALAHLALGVSSCAFF